MGYKNFPTSESVTAHIQQQWGNFTQTVLQKVGHLEAEYKRMRRRRRIGYGFLSFAAILYGIVDSDSSSVGDLVSFASGIFETILLILFLPFMIGSAALGAYLVYDKSGIIMRFNKELNAIMFEQIFSMFSIPGSHMAPTAPAVSSDEKHKLLFDKNKKVRGEAIAALISPEIKQVKAILEHSELVTEPHNRVMIDDMVHIEHKGGAVFLSELDLKHETGSGKNSKLKKIFKGYFVSIDLERTLTGKTFISTQGDKKGFGHRSFWKNLKGKGAVETQLEWNDFEDLLHVAATDEVEARYVLSTTFMEDLYDWWSEKKENIRISFVDSRMYILFPDKDIRFFNSVPKLDTNSLQEYMATIAVPLMHVLSLVEDVELIKK